MRKGEAEAGGGDLKCCEAACGTSASKPCAFKPLVELLRPLLFGGMLDFVSELCYNRYLLVFWFSVFG